MSDELKTPLDGIPYDPMNADNGLVGSVAQKYGENLRRVFGGVIFTPRETAVICYAAMGREDKDIG